MDSEIDFFKIETNNIAPHKGCILVSEPFLNDIYFKRSIVFLTEHNDDGSVGFVLNKPVNLNIQEVISDFPSFDCQISIGGPVNTNTVHYLHTLGDIIPNSVHINGNLFWGGDFDILKTHISEGLIKKEQVRFFLGYSGWSPSQLDEEIEQNSWLVSKMNPEVIMMANMNQIWKDVLQTLGSKYRMWINSPENPTMN